MLRTSSFYLQVRTWKVHIFFCFYVWVRGNSQQNQLEKWLPGHNYTCATIFKNVPILLVVIRIQKRIGCFLRYLSTILELFTSKITSFPTFVWKAHRTLSTNKYDIFITINRHCPKIEMVIGVRWPLDAYFIVPTCSLFASNKM